MDDKGSPSGPGAIAKALELLNAQKDEDASALVAAVEPFPPWERAPSVFAETQGMCVLLGWQVYQ